MASAACYPQAALCASELTGSYPIATTLRPLSSTSEDGGWLRGGKCGASGIGTPCGLYLGSSLCGGGGGGSSCNCGPFTDEYCTYSHYAEGHNYQFDPDPTVDRPAEERIIRELLRRASSAPLPDYAERIWRLYQNASSLHIKVTAGIWVAPDISEDNRAHTGRGGYEYWESEGRFRQRIDAPAELGLAQFSDIAYDGAMYQILMSDSGVLSLSSQDSRTSPKPLRNPAFLPLEFLVAQVDRQCPSCDLRLADFASIPLGERRQIEKGSGSRFEAGLRAFPAQPRFFLQDKAGIRVIEEREGRNRVLRIGLSDFRPVQGVLFPFHMTVTHLRKGKPVLKTSYAVELVEFNTEIDESVFSVSWEGVNNIYDEDRRSFVHTLACPPNECRAH